MNETEKTTALSLREIACWQFPELAQDLPSKRPSIVAAISSLQRGAAPSSDVIRFDGFSQRGTGKAHNEDALLLDAQVRREAFGCMVPWRTIARGTSRSPTAWQPVPIPRQPAGACWRCCGRGWPSRRRMLTWCPCCARCRRDYARLGRWPRLRGMASTLVGCRVVGAEVTVFNVGDSRAYLLASDRAVLLSRDHSVLNDMVEDGDLSAEQAGDAASFLRGLTSQFAVEADVEAEDFQVKIATLAWRPGERLLLCSDGLNEALSDARIASGLAAGADAAQLLTLCKQARRAGGTDDFSVVVLSRAAQIPISMQGVSS